MKIGAMNNPAKNILEEIDWIGENGFDFVDLTYEPPSSGNFNVSEIKEHLKHYNLKIVGHTNPTLPAIYPIRKIREACLDELKKSADFLSILGAEKISIHPFYLRGHQDERVTYERNIDVLNQISEYCQNIGIQPMFENYITPFASPQAFLEIKKRVKGIKIHLDVGHCNLAGRSDKVTEEFFKKFKEDIIHLHMHDNKGFKDEHLPLGCGTIDWIKIIEILKRSGYDGTITLEVFSPDKEYLSISREKLLKLWKSTKVSGK
jgi:sugar phosphate isomerase/epimerase